MRLEAPEGRTLLTTKPLRLAAPELWGSTTGLKASSTEAALTSQASIAFDIRGDL